jgi:hypothetical protein
MQAVIKTAWSGRKIILTFLKKTRPGTNLNLCGYELTLCRFKLDLHESEIKYRISKKEYSGSKF